MVALHQSNVPPRMTAAEIIKVPIFFIADSNASSGFNHWNWNQHQSHQGPSTRTTII